jgi:hypothetical protein
VVRKTSPAVDLDNRQPSAVGLFENGIAADVDLAQLEAELFAQASHLLECTLAQMATRRMEDDNLDHMRSLRRFISSATKAAG